MKRGMYGETVLSSEQIAYLHGRIDKEIELFAASTLHCTATELTEKLATVLLNTGIRSEHNVSPLLENASTGSAPLATVEMVSSPHSKSSGKRMSDETREKLRKIAKARWAAMSQRAKNTLLNKMARARLKG